MSIFAFWRRRPVNTAEVTSLRALERLTRLSGILDCVDPKGVRSAQIAALASLEGYPTTTDRIAALRRADFAAVPDISNPEIDAIDWATARLELSEALEAYNKSTGDTLGGKIMDIYPRPDLSTPDGIRAFAHTLPIIAKCGTLANQIERRHADA